MHFTEETKPRQHIKRQRHYLANKGPSSQSYGFFSNHVWMLELNHKESWVLKNWCFWTVVLEKTLEGPLECKEIQPAHSEGDQPWDYFGRNDAKAEAPVLWPPDGKSWLIGKDSDSGRDWRQEKKGTTEDEMAGCHHWLDGRESEWTPGVGDGQGGLACCDSWGCKESDMTEWLNWTEAFPPALPCLFHGKHNEDFRSCFLYSIQWKQITKSSIPSGRSINVHLLVEEISKNLWTYIKNAPQLFINILG